MHLSERIDQLHWDNVADQLNQKGYALLKSTLTGDECGSLTNAYADGQLYRKTINMERYRFGLGEYKYYSYPLPLLIQSLRETVYPKLSPIANNWMRVLGIDKQFPETFGGLMELCHQHQQTKPTALILKYGPGGYNTLHQDLYGEVFFPMQMVLFLNEAGVNYQGGEFVLIEQRPRAQSKAMVLKPAKGDILIFTTNFRPVQGSKGYYRVNMKHGVSELTAGQRFTAGVIFHDAL